MNCHGVLVTVLLRELQHTCDAVNHNYIAANTDAHRGNPSHLKHNATNPNAQVLLRVT